LTEFRDGINNDTCTEAVFPPRDTDLDGFYLDAKLRKDPVYINVHECSHIKPVDFAGDYLSMLIKM